MSLTNKYLCTRCHNFLGLTETGEVKCKGSSAPVEPVLKRTVRFFEKCLHRMLPTDEPGLNSKQVRLLAAYARHQHKKYIKRPEEVRMQRISNFEMMLRRKAARS